MASFTKRLLSGSTNGKPIKVVATSTAGTTVHTAVAGTTAGTYDEIWLWAQNNYTIDVVITIEWGDASTENNIKLTVPYQSGLIPLIPGFILQNSLTVKVFAGVANVVSIHGFVNTITD